MLKELFDAVVLQTTKAMRPTVVHADAEPNHVYLLAHADGKVEQREALPEPRAHRAGDLSAIIEMVHELTRRSEESVSDTNLVVWYSREAVVLLLDDATRRDRLTLPLTLHPQLLALQQLEQSKQQFDQKGFVSLLRIQFAGCLGPAGNLIEIVRQVKFKQHQDGHGVVQHGKASIGRSIQSELTGAGTIPEQTTLDVPVFAGPLAARRYAIECAIEVDPASERFQLIPFPGAVEAAICAAEAQLGADLRDATRRNTEEDEAAVYYGMP